jgi:hypothetical protein
MLITPATAPLTTHNPYGTQTSKVERAELYDKCPPTPIGQSPICFADNRDGAIYCGSRHHHASIATIPTAEIALTTTALKLHRSLRELVATPAMIPATGNSQTTVGHCT